MLFGFTNRLMMFSYFLIGFDSGCWWVLSFPLHLVYFASHLVVILQGR